MKRFLLLIVTSLLLLGCNKDDFDSISNRLDNLENRVNNLEEICRKANSDIESLKIMVSALQNGKVITDVAPVMDGSKEIGYTIRFSDGKVITVYHGKEGQDGINGQDGITPKLKIENDYWYISYDNGTTWEELGKATGEDGQDGITPKLKIENDYWYISYDNGATWEELGKATGEDGQDGITPVIGVKEDIDGVYYWTLNGEWLLDDNGDKVKAEGKDGQNGSDGKPGADGENGTNGQDGITPKLKIENDYWYISYDNGVTWEELGKATGEDGQNGTDALCIIKSVVKTDTEVIFTLNDGTVISIPMRQTIEIFFNLKNSEIGINKGKTIYIGYTVRNATEHTIVSASSDGNFITKVEPDSIGKGHISVKCIDDRSEGYINVMVKDDTGNFDFKIINIYENQIIFPEGLEYNVAPQGGEVTVPFSTNFDYIAEIVSGDSWVNIVPSTKSEMREETIVLSVSNNTTTSLRTARIVLRNPSYSDDIYAEVIISQSSRNFSIDKTHFSVYQDGGTFSALITSTLGVIAKIPDNISWLKPEVIKLENEINYKLNMTVDAINTQENRNTVISLYDSEGKILLGEVNIVQSGIDAETAGAMILVTRANYGNEFTAYLPIDGNVDCYVSWGDGEVEYYNGNYSSEIISHVYSISEPTSFDIKISGKVESLDSKKLPFRTITDIKQWGNLGLMSMKNAFRGSNLLKSIASETFGAFDYVTNFNSAFYGCSSLTSIPSELFYNSPLVTDFGSTFYGCSSLTSIPSELFSNCPLAENFSETFYNCKSLTSLPSGLFSNCPAVTDFSKTFYDCSSLTSIPSELFSNCPLAENFSETFYNCKSLTSLPSGLFSNCPAVTDFSKTFYFCSSLKSIPSDLFSNCPIVTNFGGTFLECGLSSIPAELFSNCTEVTSFSYTFYGCISLTTIPSILFSNCPKVTSFTNTFANCSSLTSIPASLFDNNRKVKYFSETFNNCMNLTGESPYTIIDGVKYHLYERSMNPDYFVSGTSCSYCFRNCKSLTDYYSIPDNWK